MASGDKIIIPAQAAGFASFFGHITKGAGDTLNIPEGMLNIGGNGKGYLLNEAIDWDPVANTDGSFAALALGDDVYIYAVQDPSGIAQYVASKNSTFPDDYTASNSRKIGGFHYGRVRTVAERYDTVIIPATQIVPNSVWDLQHRPTCDPTGMVEVVPGKLWVDIYLSSEGSGTWPENIPVSRYGVSPIKDDIYARVDFHLLARNAGKRVPNTEEFLTYAEGAPQGNDADNDTAWSATTNTGPTNTGAVAKAVSMFNVVDSVGNLWDWLDALNDVGNVGSATNTFEFDQTVVDVGVDATYPRGKVQHVLWKGVDAGGTFMVGVKAGARSINFNVSPEHIAGQVGLRCVCDAK